MLKRLSALLLALFLLFAFPPAARADVIAPFPRRNDAALIIIAGLIIALIAGTAILIRIFLKRKK